LLSYEKAPRGTSPAAMLSPHRFFSRIANPDRLAAALKASDVSEQQGGTPSSEFSAKDLQSAHRRCLCRPNRARPTVRVRSMRAAAATSPIDRRGDARGVLRSVAVRADVRETAGLTEAAQRLSPGVMVRLSKSIGQHAHDLDLLKKPGLRHQSSMNLLPALSHPNRNRRSRVDGFPRSFDKNRKILSI